jgi:hypothetical protein
MAVVNIPPDGQIYQLGQIASALHVYNTNNPAGAHTLYNITIINVGNWLNVQILPGHTDTYHPAGNNVFLQNNGPSRLQALFLDQEKELTPEAAGWTVVEQMPKSSA